MLTEERHSFILDQLDTKNTITVQELVERLNHSESTIRRDLTTLEDQNKLVRIHGGAKKKRKPVDEPTMDEKTVKYMQEKEKISQLAASLIDEYEVVYLDAGTTTYTMIPYLEGKDITVVTNGVPHASLLIDYNIESILVGGKIKQRTKAIIGSIAERQLEEFNFTKAFMGINGIDLEQGYTTPDVEEAAIKRKAIKQSNQSYILADISKIGDVSFVKVADIDECTLITTKLPEEKKELNEYTRVMEA
ncbi:DeoR/GlpR family DNA-binding transcription regulator [Alkalibacterium sp. 20]|uniref:DeoR/GlpR family DNA-binding transcription regulator n=1 Tax=Alkalibacterium sp. 20 TaxID=1798803 RepID=UPI0008FFFD3F|nr:DeoR/GlpR family DNA-binding transcription regulator [Alkalibacterium sp. 20]OJF97023.1 DeoR family transcriptional regulator [Alkalibacterium sp. 20]